MTKKEWARKREVESAEEVRKRESERSERKSF